MPNKKDEKRYQQQGVDVGSGMLARRSEFSFVLPVAGLNTLESFHLSFTPKQQEGWSDGSARVYAPSEQAWTTLKKGEQNTDWLICSQSQAGLERALEVLAHWLDTAITYRIIVEDITAYRTVTWIAINIHFVEIKKDKAFWEELTRRFKVAFGEIC